MAKLVLRKEDLVVHVSDKGLEELVRVLQELFPERLVIIIQTHSDIFEFNIVNMLYKYQANLNALQSLNTIYQLKTSNPLSI